MAKFMSSTERPKVEALAALADCNQFLPERISHEKRALGGAYQAAGRIWHVETDLHGANPNLEALAALAESLGATLRTRLSEGVAADAKDQITYEGLIRYHLFYRYEKVFLDLVEQGECGKSTSQNVPEYEQYERDVEHFLRVPGLSLPFPVDSAWLFGWGYQIRRAWHHTFGGIYGGSMPAAQLRAAVWQSIFTHDFQRYRRSLFAHMGEVPTLIVGESGTGKELVARAVGRSRFIPFDAKKRSFEADFSKLFFPVNLSALSANLIESELFGARKGAFTGAAEDRSGWFETCPELGTVFLDEIGEVSEEIQVKLLRTLQSRTFHRVGEVEERRFDGKIMAATNRDLEAEMESGGFRQDFFYRLSGDVIHTATLRDQLAESPNDLANLVLVLAKRVGGPIEAERLASECVDWVEGHLPSDYAWRGNVRELEQCVRNIMIRGAYQPLLGGPGPGPETQGNGLDAALANCELDADALVSRYCTHAYARYGSYEEAARRLGLDRRTIKAKIDDDLLKSLKG